MEGTGNYLGRYALGRYGVQRYRTGGSGLREPRGALLVSPDEAVLLVSVPGVQPESLDIRAQGDEVTIQGETRVPPPPPGAAVVLHELHGGTFERTVALPYTIDAAAAQASLHQGLLVITLPRAVSKGRQVRVTRPRAQHGGGAPPPHGSSAAPAGASAGPAAGNSQAAGLAQPAPAGHTPPHAPAPPPPSAGAGHPAPPLPPGGPARANHGPHAPGEQAGSAPPPSTKAPARSAANPGTPSSTGPTSPETTSGTPSAAPTAVSHTPPPAPAQPGGTAQYQGGAGPGTQSKMSPAAASPQGAAQDNQPSGAPRRGTATKSDGEIRQEVLEAISQQAPNAGDVTVDVEDGRVTLRGTVDTCEDKRTIEDLAYRLPGVRDVFDELHYRNEPPSGNVGDEQLGHQVAQALSQNDQVAQGSRIEVNVNGGVVTLVGSTDTKDTKKLATDIAFGVEGVRDVFNELHVAGGGTLEGRISAS